MVCWILAGLFFVAGALFLCGKGDFLIAGFRAAGDDAKARYDEAKLKGCFAVFCLGIAALMGLTAYVDTERFALFVMLPLIVVLLLFLFLATSFWCRK